VRCGVCNGVFGHQQNHQDLDYEDSMRIVKPRWTIETDINHIDGYGHEADWIRYENEKLDKSGQ
jgi:hypothetical protein